MASVVAGTVGAGVVDPGMTAVAIVVRCLLLVSNQQPETLVASDQAVTDVELTVLVYG